MTEAEKSLAETKKQLEKIKESMPKGYWSETKLHNAQSSFFEPYAQGNAYLSGIKTLSRARYGSINARTLRSVAQKAWIINVCINHVIKKLKPYFKPVTDSNRRGFQLIKNGELVADVKGRKAKEKKEVESFLLNTGKTEDSERDDLVRFCCKTIRDLLTIDQIATEIQRDEGGDVTAFYAIDSATIERVMPSENTALTYLQVIDGVAVAGYGSDDIVFDYENPRTDIYHSFYGYSYVEQAVDLVTSQINAFAYNSGNFTDNKLPRGMLLIDGDANDETVSQIEDYLAEVMSGSPANQWRIPVIPSGMSKGEGGGIKWQELNGKNRDMEFSQWQDFLTSGIVALFGCSMDELGLQSAKSQNMFEREGNGQMEASKSLILGDILTFMANYINKILKKAYPEYSIEFVGYEQTDLKAVADLDKIEVESYKTLNEKREEKGLKKLEADWANVPLNPQCVQLYQSANAAEQQGGGDDWGDMDSSDFEDDNNTEEAADDDNNVDTIEKSLRV